MSAADEQLFQRFGREFPAGTVLFRDGEPGKEMFVVHTGVVQIHKRVRDVEQVLGRLGAGEFFGEMALLNNRPRNASATVIEPSKLLVIDPRTFDAMIRGNIEIAVRLIKKLAARLEDSNEQIETLMLRDPASRVVHYLWRQAEKQEPAADGTLHVPTHLGEVPARVGLRVDQVKDVMDRLQRARLATLNDDGVTVTSVSKLEEYLRFLEMKEKFGDV